MGWLWALTAAQVAAGTIVPWPLNISFEQLLRATDEVSPRPTWEGTAVNVGAGDGISYDETASLFAAGFGGVSVHRPSAPHRRASPTRHLLNNWFSRS